VQGLNGEENDRPDVFLALEKALPVLIAMTIPGAIFIPIPRFLGLLSAQAMVGLTH
jgi:hypothetical protein